MRDLNEKINKVLNGELTDKNQIDELMKSLKEVKKEIVKKEKQKSGAGVFVWFIKELKEKNLLSFYNDNNKEIKKAILKSFLVFYKKRNTFSKHKTFIQLLSEGYTTYFNEKGVEKIDVKIIEIEKVGRKKAINKDEEIIIFTTDNNNKYEGFIYPSKLENFKPGLMNFDAHGYLR